MVRPVGITLAAGVGALGNALVALCRERGRGVRALAKEMGFPQMTVYHWIQGRKPRQAALMKLHANCPELRTFLTTHYPALAALRASGAASRSGAHHPSWSGSKRSRVADGPQ